MFWSHFHMNGAYIGSGFLSFFISVRRHSFRWVLAVTVQTSLLCFKEINELIKKWSSLQLHLLMTNEKWMWPTSGVI